MKLIVGLGNPGKKYKNTRHNIGVTTLKKLCKNKNTFFSEWKFIKKFNAEISQATINKEKIILAIPQTFMNNSGDSVSALANFYKIKPKKILILHDDIDIPLGEFKIQKDKSSAGHRGIESIIEKIGTKSFERIRIGINPKIKKGISELKIPTEKFVLKDFTQKEKNILEKTIKKISLVK
ncbi:aminoacyl-tRNA hydrolase [bacterium]|nr:aminoacyl-tRNA hydrolase [bacterium]